MASDETRWSVRPHGQPVALGQHVWRVTGAPLALGLERVMTVARLEDGDLMLHGAIALDEAGMAWLTGLGRVRWIVVPSSLHRLDAPRYKARFPEALVVCPAGAKAKVEQKVPVDHTYAQAPLTGERVALAHLDGVGELEGVMIVRDPDGTVLVFNDLLFNVHGMSGLFWFIYGRLMGNSGKPRVTTTTRWLLIKDRAAFAAHLTRLAAIEGLAVVVPGHGELITDDASGALRAVAASL